MERKADARMAGVSDLFVNNVMLLSKHCEVGR